MIQLKKIDSIFKIGLQLLIVFYIGILSYYGYCRFKAFGYYDWDLAVYDQIIWNITQGNWFSSLLGVHFLGHHAHFLAFPMAIFYKIFPHPLTLLFLQTAAIGLAAVPLFLLARKLINNQWAFIICCCYFLHQGIGYSNIYEFHFTSFAPLILFSMFYLFFIEKYTPFLITVALALLCQENFALFIFTFAVFAILIRRSPRWWLPVLVSSVIYFIFCIKFLFPYLNPGKIQFLSI